MAVVALLSSAGHGQETRRVLLSVATVAWGLRLAVFIGWRSRGKGEDPRYADLLSRAQGNRDLRVLRSPPAAAGPVTAPGAAARTRPPAG